jgi:hypothetical protein
VPEAAPGMLLVRIMRASMSWTSTPPVQVGLSGGCSAHARGHAEELGISSGFHRESRSHG